MRRLPTIAALSAACTVPPPTMMAPLDEAAPVTAGTVSVVASGGGAIIPDETASVAPAAGADLEIAVSDNVSIAIGGGIQNFSTVGQLALRVRTGGVDDRGWIGQLQLGGGVATLYADDWFTADAIGVHVGLTGSAPVSPTARAFVGGMITMNLGTDDDRVFIPWTYVGAGVNWDLPAGDKTRLVLGVQAYGLGLVIPVSPGLSAQLGVRFGKAPASPSSPAE